MPELVFSLLLQCLAPRVTLLVVGPTGEALPAIVEARSPGASVVADRQRAGTYLIAWPAAAPAAVQVSVPGYLTRNVELGPLDCAEVRVELLPLVDGEVITVTAERAEAPLATTASAVTVVTGADLQRAPQRTLDEVLRGTPGFSLFRASSSRVANPTAQGMTLRGLGGSGASRALVLLDGAPLNDAFGGWVAWGRVPEIVTDRVEVARGGASDLYGSGALTGVVQVISRVPARPEARVVAEGGSGSFARVSGAAGAALPRGSLLLGADLVTDAGAYVVSEAQRGAVDERAGADHLSAFGRADAKLGRSIRLTARGSIYDETRRNGTALQVNDTNATQWAASVSVPGRGGAWQVRSFGGRQTYDQSFTSVLGGRNVEVLTRRQRVPADQAGIGVDFQRQFGTADVMVGGDAARVDGLTREIAYAGGVAAATTEAGGRHDMAGAFAHLRWSLASCTFTGGARAERWRVRDRSSGASRDRTAFVPRLTAGWALDPWRLQLAAYTAFRAPTLNELFRGFRVGDTITRANPGLLPERARGFDVTALRSSGRASLRATVFSMWLDDPIVNVTVSATPALIVRERRNAGQLHSRGLEAEGKWRAAAGVELFATLVFTDARFSDGPEPALDGKRVPQVPRSQFGAGARLSWQSGTAATLEVRHYGERYEDDLNALPLGRVTTVDALLAQRVHAGVQVFAAFENLLAAEYLVGRTPLPTIGVGPSARVGIRWSRP
jgi:outer membrane cobalamin receptor